MSAIRRFGVVPATVIVVSGLVGAAAGCSGSGSSGAGAASGGSGGGGVALADGGVAASRAPSTLGPLDSAQAVGGNKTVGSPGGGAALGEPFKLPALQSAVIKTAGVRLRVDHGQFGQTRSAVRRIASDLNGYVTHSTTSGAKIHAGRITIRVPAQSFRQALDSIEGVAHVHVTAETITGQDVSQQFVDLNARLVNLRAQEKVLLRLMDRAQTIAESIRVENYLQSVEFQIEDVQGRMLYLQNRTSMSTISVALQEAGKKPAPPQHASAIWKAGERSLGAALAVVTSVIVGAGLVIPISILVLLALLVGRRLAPLAPQLRPRSAAGPSPSDEG
ncbi:MAG TPA: DUF4349 domain-containing protein [Gaiellales bacterium]|nr:DUF4349 domain-containing protein [Gaiellales bacterium]